MTDSSRSTIGSRDDLVIDVSRCLRMRFSDSICRRCIDTCPHRAVTLETGLSISADLCCGCLLCTAECPAGALEQPGDFSDCVSRLTAVTEPVLGCVRTRECAHAHIACLGGMSEEHLLSLFHAVSGRLTLNLSQCRDCRNNPVIDPLRERVDTLLEAGLAGSTCSIIFDESMQNIHCCDESVDRRSFFRLFGRALIKGADIVVSASGGPPEQRTENYAEKRLPARRRLLDRIRGTVSRELDARMRIYFDSRITINEKCIACQGCVAICPTGALRTDMPDSPPAFNFRLCTGCGLCCEFCQDGALRMSAVEASPSKYLKCL